MNVLEISKAIEKVVGEMGLNRTDSDKLREVKSIPLKVAKQLAEEVEKEALRQNMKIVVAVADASGNPIAVHAMDDSYIASYTIAVNKAYTSVALKMPTKDLAELANPNGGSLYGIQFTDPKIVIFGGGEPLKVNGKIVGAVAVSGGSAEQDTKLGEYAQNKFKEIMSWQ